MICVLLFQRLLEQVIVAKPTDPVAYLIELLKRDNNDGKMYAIL